MRLKKSYEQYNISGRREIPIDDDDVYRMGGSLIYTNMEQTEFGDHDNDDADEVLTVVTNS